MHFGRRYVNDKAQLLGLDLNHEFTEFTDTVNFGVCREFWHLPRFAVICRDFSQALHFCD